MTERGRHGPESQALRAIAGAPRAAIVEYLAGQRVLRGIPRSALSAIAPEIIARRYERGHYFFRTGDAASHVFAIVSGLVSLSEDDPSGRGHDLYTLSSGDIFGIAAAMLGIPRTRSAKALSDSSVFLIGRETFQELQLRYPHFARNVTLELCRLLCLSEKNAGQFALMRVPTRLAKLFADSEPGVLAAMSSSQRELALHVGCSRETVSRILSRWERESIVSVRRGRVRVLNRAKLDALANGGGKVRTERP
jgi:CRP/FNR family transcriptional regulator, cyclic AMP receptor protein